MNEIAELADSDLENVVGGYGLNLEGLAKQHIAVETNPWGEKGVRVHIEYSSGRGPTKLTMNGNGLNVAVKREDVKSISLKNTSGKMVKMSKSAVQKFITE